MRDSLQLRAAVAHELAELHQLRATLPLRQLITLLDTLIDSHLEDLTTIDPDHLRFKQGAIRQLQCLRAVLLEDHPNLSPKA
jgi:hypothetical protein